MRKIFSGLLVFMLLLSCTQCTAASGEQNYDDNEETDKKQVEGGDDSVGNSDKKIGEQDEGKEKDKDVGSNEKNNGLNEDNRDKESGSDVKDKDKEEDCEDSADEGDDTPEDDEEECDIPEDDEEKCDIPEDDEEECGTEDECDVPEDEEDGCNEDSENNIDESEEDENKESDDKDYEKEFDKNIDIQDEKGGSGTGTAVVTRAFMQVEASPDQVLDDSIDLSTKTMNEYVKVSAQPIENSSERKGGIIYQGLSILSVLIFCIFISILSAYWKIK